MIWGYILNSALPMAGINCSLLDAGGYIGIHQNINTVPETFLSIITPFREEIVVVVECMFPWYWIADLCFGLFID
jgi:hypothetical protein